VAGCSRTTPEDNVIATAAGERGRFIELGPWSWAGVAIDCGVQGLGETGHRADSGDPVVRIRPALISQSSEVETPAGDPTSREKLGGRPPHPEELVAVDG